MNINENYQKLFDENEDDDSLIINEDLFEQKVQETSEEEDQIIIQNDEKENECSFNSKQNKSNSFNNNNINIDNKKEENLTDIKYQYLNRKNNNILKELLIDKNIKKENKEINNINQKEIDFYKNIGEKIVPIKMNREKDNKVYKYAKKVINKQSYKINKKIENALPSKDSQILKISSKNKIKVKKEHNNSFNKINNSAIVKKYRRNNLINDIGSKIINKRNSDHNLMKNENNKTPNINIKKLRDKNNIKTENNKSKIKVIKDNENINKMKKNNFSKNININKENNNNFMKNEYRLNNKLKNKSKSKNKRSISQKDDTKKNNKLNNNKSISCEKRQNNDFYNFYSAKNYEKKKNIYIEKKSKNNSMNKEKAQSSYVQGEIIIQRKKNYDSEILKKILINKINSQIDEVIKSKKSLYFNENNNLFFLGFCDLLFDLGFLHIKETEIKDITKFEEHINYLYTQPFTNRDILSEEFLFNEQKLLICAWKTILNNFHLIKEFTSLPSENEEITLDDCKLFIFIITGLFIGYTRNKYINKEINYNSLTNIKDFNKIPKPKNYNQNNRKKISFSEYSKDKISRFSNSQNNSPSSKKSNIYFIKQNLYNKNNYSENNNKENVLKKILENRQKSEYNYKNILQIKNFFYYFAELRKLYNLYKKDIKNLSIKMNIEKDFTFHPKTNKNNHKLFKKFLPSMNFFERNDLFKNLNEKKIEKLEKERTKELLKECTFEPIKRNKKIKINPIEISNRLYYTNSNKKNSSTDLNHTNNDIIIKTNKKRGEDSSNSKVFYKPKIRANYIKKFNFNNKINKVNLTNNNNNSFNNINSNTPKSKINTSYHKSNNYKSFVKEEEYNFSPNINKKFNRIMFWHSPLTNDNLLIRRINCLRDANFKRFVHNYEKNSRETLTKIIKNDKIILKQMINEDKGNMKLDIEKKTNKDTFDIFKNYRELKGYRIINEPLFIVEIKIKNEIKLIEVYQDDIPEKIAYEFCTQNSLGQGSYEKILNIINEKLEEIHNEIYGEKKDHQKKENERKNSKNNNAIKEENKENDKDNNSKDIEKNINQNYNEKKDNNMKDNNNINNNNIELRNGENINFNGNNIINIQKGDWKNKENNNKNINDNRDIKLNEEKNQKIEDKKISTEEININY